MKTIVVIGAGAAGLTAAYFAKIDSTKVILLERNDQAGKKILMSGGSRCNLLPMHFEQSDYVSSGSPNTLRNVFKSWSLNACKSWFEEELGLAMSSEVSTNKWFPSSNSAKDVRDVLVQGCLKKNVQIRYNWSVENIESTPTGGFVVSSKTDNIECDKVILCSGGLSIPSAGTDGSGHRILKKMGVEIIPVYPALTPLLGSAPNKERLSGVTIQVSSKGVASEYEMEGKRSGMLFTHKGFSGPAILDISHVISNFNGGQILIDFTEGSFEEVWTKALSDNITIHSLFRRVLPKRVAEALINESNVPDKKIAEASKQLREDTKTFLASYKLNVSKEEGYKKAEVTGGGVSLDAVKSKTLELKDIPGLYVCGEIVDVFGRIGGFNFYWAWVSGRLAGKSAAK